MTVHWAVSAITLSSTLRADQGVPGYCDPGPGSLTCALKPRSAHYGASRPIGHVAFVDHVRRLR